MDFSFDKASPSRRGAADSPVRTGKLELDGLI
jgi:hypothetical protein